MFRLWAHFNNSFVFRKIPDFLIFLMQIKFKIRIEFSKEEKKTHSQIQQIIQLKWNRLCNNKTQNNMIWLKIIQYSYLVFNRKYIYQGPAYYSYSKLSNKRNEFQIKFELHFFQSKQWSKFIFLLRCQLNQVSGVFMCWIRHGTYCYIGIATFIPQILY